MKKIFIIHGWTYSLDKWTEVCKSLQAKGIEPVLLKVPGLTDPSDQVWDIEGYVDWLDKQLADEINPVIVGHSNGGRIALSYIQHNPGRIAKLILIDSAGVPHDERRSRAKLAILRGLSKIGKIFVHGRLPKKIFYKLIGAQDYFNASPSMRITMGNMLATDKTIKLSGIKLATTIIWGREDAITPLADGEKLKAGIDGSKLYIVDDARHAPFANHPDEVADIIAGALK